jgi:AcrR family transcriptional regulator
MAELVAEVGYPEVTVTDVVGRARVSKRTFYQHFSDREECFLATYVALAELPLLRIGEVIADPAVQELGTREQIGRATGAYLEAMAERPRLTRALLTQVASTGARGRRVRREVLHRFADRLVDLSDDAHARHPEVRPMTRPMALAVVGGINELVLDAVDRDDGPAGPVEGGPGAEEGRSVLGPVLGSEGPAWGDAGALTELASTVTDLVVAVLTAPS